MQPVTSIILLTLTATATLTTAQSCGGSIRCPNDQQKQIALRLADSDPQNGPEVVNADSGSSIDQIDLQRRYADGDQIACFRVSGGGVCAFLERTGSEGLTGDKIKELAGMIPAAGCKSCGSVPINLATGQEGRDGILKFDFTRRTCLDQDGGEVQLC